MTTTLRRRGFALLTAGLAAASFAAAIVPYTQGFETDAAGWFDQNSPSPNDWYGTVERVVSGTDGITSAVGGHHAQMTGTDSGPFSRFSAYSDEFVDGFAATIDVYLDPAWNAGAGFDLSVAASGSDGLHQRDFIFHVAKDISSDALLVAGSNNTNFAVRQDLDNLANSYEVTTAGWYTLRWTFRDNAGTLAVDMELLTTTGASLFLETRQQPGTQDEIANIGGNRYMWFTVIAPGLTVNVDQQNIGIPGPTSKDECKNGGYAKYGYRNQGACVSDLMSNRPEA